MNYEQKIVVHWPKTSIVNRQQLAAAAKLTNIEIPGLAYTNDNSYVMSYASEIPLVDHYLPQQNCSFIQVQKRQSLFEPSIVVELGGIPACFSTLVLLPKQAPIKLES